MRFFEAAGDVWGFGCLVVYMLTGELPFLDVSDADMILSMIKLLGVPSKDYLAEINFKNFKKFIFPKMYKKSMRKVLIIRFRLLNAMIWIY